MTANTEIKTWQERGVYASDAVPDGNAEIAMCEEIAELRAALEAARPASQQVQAQAAPWYSFSLEKTGDEHHDASNFLLNAATEWWEASKRANVCGAVKWLTSEDGALLIFTRAEYRQQLLENIHKLEQNPVDFFAPAAQQGDGELPQDERAAFESWARKNLRHDLNRASDGTYYAATVDKDWHVWQASAALAQRATEPPSFSRDPDGDLALDWHVGDDMLSVSFSNEGRVAWAATIAGKSLSGSEHVAQRAGSGPSPHSIGFNDDLPEGWERAADGCVIPPAGTVGEAYTAPPAAVQPDSNLQTALTVFDMGLGFALCHRDFAEMRNAVKKLQQDFTAIRAMVDRQPDSGRDAALRNIISNAIHGYGCQVEDHAGVVDAIAKALAAQPSEQAAAAPQKKES